MRALVFFVSIFLSIEQLHGQHIEGVELIEFTQSACDRESNPYRMKPRIISMKKSKDTLLLEIGLALTCCLDYVPHVKYLSDTLYLNFGIKDEGNACACWCCYGFNYKLKGIHSSGLTVKFSNMIIELSKEKYWDDYQPTFAIVEGDTLNLRDKYGLRQGIWTNPNAGFSKLEEPKRRVSKLGHPNKEWDVDAMRGFSESFKRYKDDRVESFGQLNKNLVVKEEYILEKRIKREFYSNGKIKKECKENNEGQMIECRQWKENGEELP